MTSKLRGGRHGRTCKKSLVRLGGDDSMILRRETHKDAGAHRLGGSRQVGSDATKDAGARNERGLGHTQARTGGQSCGVPKTGEGSSLPNTRSPSLQAVRGR